MSDSTKTIAQRVAAAHIRKTVQAAIGQTQARPTKTAASDRNFFAVVDKQGWRKIRQALQKDGDTASVKLWDEATRDIAKAMELPSRTDMALTKMLNLIDQGPRDPGMTRNAVFKIADLLGIKMPHGIFASTDKQAKHKHGLPPYGSWRKFVDIVQLREAQDTTHLANEDLKHALSELRGGFAQFSLEDNRDLKAIQAAVIDAQNILHEKVKLQDKFNKQMNVVYGALKKAGKV